MFASLVACSAMAAAIAVVADDNSSSSATPGQSSSSIQSDVSKTGSSSSSATNSNNPPQSDLSTTEQQKRAPVVDPQSATTGSPATSTSSTTTASGSDAPQTGQVPQRYDANRTTGTEIGNARRSGASLGVNVVTSESGQGVMVARTRAGTPADQMGLQPRDRILTLNGQPVSSVNQFIAAIRGMNPGDQIELSIDRGGNPQNLGGRLEALRERLAAREGPVGNMIGRTRDLMREQQASYAEGTGVRPSGDIEARLSQLEQQVDRLTREIEQLRANPSSLQTSPSSTLTSPSSTTPPAGAGTTPPSTR
jgi:PDZ domain